MESPDHQRFNPPVERHVLVAEEPVHAVGAWVRERIGSDADAALSHRGVHFRGERLAEWPDALEAGDVLRVYLFRRAPEVVQISSADVLYDRDGWVAVNKPAWLPVQGTRASLTISLETQLRSLVGCDWLSPVHRLDRQTSGVNLFARTPQAFEAAAAQFRRRTARKVYLTRVESAPILRAFSVEGYICRAHHGSHSAFQLCPEPGPDSRYSRTEFIQREGTLLEARPITGRTHQIRVHLAARGCPVAGDTLYGQPWSPGAPQRVLLHAAALTLGALTLEAPTPRDLDPEPDADARAR
ncbi:MAG: RNA pseudouridine synthase [Myxococcota bacterium]